MSAGNISARRLERADGRLSQRGKTPPALALEGVSGDLEGRTPSERADPSLVLAKRRASLRPTPPGGGPGTSSALRRLQGGLRRAMLLDRLLDGNLNQDAAFAGLAERLTDAAAEPLEEEMHTLQLTAVGSATTFGDAAAPLQGAISELDAALEQCRRMVTWRRADIPARLSTDEACALALYTSPTYPSEFYTRLNHYLRHDRGHLVPYSKMLRLLLSGLGSLGPREARGGRRGAPHPRADRQLDARAPANVDRGAPPPPHRSRARGTQEAECRVVTAPPVVPCPEVPRRAPPQTLVRVDRPGEWEAYGHRVQRRLFTVRVAFGGEKEVSGGGPVDESTATAAAAEEEKVNSSLDALAGEPPSEDDDAEAWAWL